MPEYIAPELATAHYGPPQQEPTMSRKWNNRRRDYRSNLRRKLANRSGCTWCGAEVPSLMDYCSDECVQADHEDMGPPITPLAYSDPAYVARKWSRS